MAGAHTCTVLPHCYSPPLLRPTSRKKRRGGRNNEDLHFRLAVKPPLLPRICVLRSTKLCCAVEDENSFDRHAVAVLKDGIKSCWPCTCRHFNSRY